MNNHNQKAFTRKNLGFDLSERDQLYGGHPPLSGFIRSFKLGPFVWNEVLMSYNADATELYLCSSKCLSPCFCHL